MTEHAASLVWGVGGGAGGGGPGREGAQAEGLGSRAWNVARLLGSAPGLRLPLQAGTTAQSPFITGLVNASSGKFDFFAEKGGEERSPGGRRGARGLPQAWPACGLSSGPDSRGWGPAVEGRGPVPGGCQGEVGRG